MTENAITRNAKQLAALADKIEEAQRTGCSCCDPTHDSPDPVVQRLEREEEVSQARLIAAVNLLERAKLAVIDADSELSAYAAGRPLDKGVARLASQGCRDVYKRIVAFLIENGGM